MEDIRNAYNILVGKAEGRRPLLRSRRKWEANIRMDLRVGRYGLEAPGSEYKLMVGPFEHSYEFLGQVKGGEFLD
jgi:hypothetical protein